MIRIEVAALPEASGASKKKGDLLQEFAREFAETRGWSVVEELRNGSSEIDLHCSDRVSGETILLECKAHRDALPKRELTNVVGDVIGSDYSQGWLISSGPLTKDAKGYWENWQKKDRRERSRLRVYCEQDLVDLMISGRIVAAPPQNSVVQLAKPGHAEPDWLLLLTEFGRFWTAPKYDGGIATQVYTFSADNNDVLTDPELLQKLSKLDSSWKGASFISVSCDDASQDAEPRSFHAPPVIETVEGSQWSDYRPCRLKDFAGRKKELDEVLQLLEGASHGQSSSRVFAITGESGIGKSSLLTGVRGKTRQRNLSKKFFSTSIDCRAARSRDYINAALVKTLEKAREAGFGIDDGSTFQVANPLHPLSSQGIADFLQSVASKRQSICVMFDQFEEIYAKPELTDVFQAAHDLFLSAVAEEGPLVLGFAWRSNFTGQFDHPAYYMWQSLHDHRVEIQLKPLDASEVGSALTAFEKELGYKLGIELRRQLVEAARGYPWLLKKLCNHLLEQSARGPGQPASVENLSVESLFSTDLQGLTDVERRTLQFVAENAPVAAFSVVEDFGDAALARLENERLVSRSGQMLNVYWDIFRDYLLSGTVPDLPFSFLPASPSIGAFLSVADQLLTDRGRTAEEISVPAQLAPRTVANVVRDLLIIGVAQSPYSKPKLASGMRQSDPKSVMRSARVAMSKHTLLRELRTAKSDGNFMEGEICELLSNIPSIPDYNDLNLLRHVRKLTTWFAATGFLQPTASGWRLSDFGDVDLSYAEHRRRRGIGPFNGGSTPRRALEVLRLAKTEKSLDPLQAKRPGYQKAFNTLSRFGLIVNLERSWNYVAADDDEIGASDLTRLHNAAKSQPSVIKTVELLKLDPKISGPTVADKLARHFGEEWSESSLKRTGNALKRWGNWVLDCERAGEVLEPLEGVRGKPRGDTPEVMEKIHAALRSGETQRAIASELGVSAAVVGKWLREEKMRLREQDS